MIKTDKDGSRLLYYADWNGAMAALCNRFADLPRRPGSQGRSSYALGIDRLQSDNRGRDRAAVAMLWGAADDLEYCPTEAEVVAMGQAVLVIGAEVDELLRDRRRNRQRARDRRARKVLVRVERRPPARLMLSGDPSVDGSDDALFPDRVRHEKLSTPRFTRRAP